MEIRLIENKTYTWSQFVKELKKNEENGVIKNVTVRRCVVKGIPKDLPWMEKKTTWMPFLWGPRFFVFGMEMQGCSLIECIFYAKGYKKQQKLLEKGVFSPVIRRNQ